jgi:hypothetical protein
VNTNILCLAKWHALVELVFGNNLIVRLVLPNILICCGVPRNMNPIPEGVIAGPIEIHLVPGLVSDKPSESLIGVTIGGAA